MHVPSGKDLLKVPFLARKTKQNKTNKNHGIHEGKLGSATPSLVQRTMVFTFLYNVVYPDSHEYKKTVQKDTKSIQNDENIKTNERRTRENYQQ